MAKRWTPKEIADLTRLYPDKRITPAELEHHFGRSWDVLKQQAKLRKIHRRPVQPWTDAERELVRQLYVDEDIPRAAIERQLSRTWRSICHEANALGLRRPKPNPCRVVRDYFHSIDTDEKAYWLGFIAADGNVCLSGRKHIVSMSLQSRDLHWLERFRDAIAPGMQLIPRGQPPHAYTLSIGSEEMLYDLINLGILPRKSYNLEWPSIPDSLAIPFLLGYFDGDGSFTPRSNRSDGQYQWMLLGTLPLLTVARALIERHAQVVLKEPVRQRKDGSPHLYRISANGPRAPIIDRMLNQSGLGLPRKHLPAEC
jgi:hypothetical protein